MTARLRLDWHLVSSFFRRGSGPRALLVAASTALVSGLLLVALTVLLFGWRSAQEQEQVGNLVADDGVRGGYVFALLLICVAPLALLRQVVRLGTATREQRLAALRLAGATPADVRRLGAVEVGLPSLLGGFLGYLVFLALRMVLGGARSGELGRMDGDSEIAREFRIVPVTVEPTWWQVLLVALAVALVGVLVGATTSRSLVVSPLGVARRAARPAPRPWGVLVMALAVPMLVASFQADSTSDLYAFGFVACLVLGLLALAPWVAYRVGRVVAARASTVPVLMAGRRLTTDARPAGRAAAAVGAISMVAGAGGALLAGLPGSYDNAGLGKVEAMYTVPVALGGIVLLAALLLVVLSMTVHGIESLVDHKRSSASLAVLGASAQELERAQRWEVGLVAVPVAVVGVLLGSAPGVLLFDSPTRYAWIPLLVDCVTILLVWMAVLASVRLTRPWLVRAAAPANLRTP